MTTTFIPYSTQSISQQDIDAVVSALQSGWLTGGKAVSDFEDAMAAFCGTRFGIAVSSGTAALHSAVHALDLSSTDEIIVPAISFAATVNAILYESAKPVFCDVVENTLLIDTSRIEALITPKTKAIIAVDYAGQLAAYAELQTLCKKYGITLIADGCHSLGAELDGIKSGNFANMTTFSFHPVKQITTGEGGMVMTNSKALNDTIRSFRNHHMSSTAAQRHQNDTHDYDIAALGYNYRLTDIQAALGLSQLAKLPSMIESRRLKATIYDNYFSIHPHIKPLQVNSTEQHAFHLYVVNVPARDAVFTAMRNRNIGVNVHYKPIYLHTLYRQKYGMNVGLCPVAERTYASILSLPLFPDLSAEDQKYVAENLIDIVNSL